MAVRLRIEMRHILPQWILTCCTMRRRSLRLLSPNLCLNSDGDTGAFFRVNVEVLSLRVNFLKGLGE